jgi:hypothetical protein
VLCKEQSRCRQQQIVESMWHSARCVHVSHEINAEAADAREEPHAGDDGGNLEPLPAEEQRRALSSAFGRVGQGQPGSLQSDRVREERGHVSIGETQILHPARIIGAFF